MRHVQSLGKSPVRHSRVRGNDGQKAEAEQPEQPEQWPRLLALCPDTTHGVEAHPDFRRGSEVRDCVGLEPMRRVDQRRAAETTDRTGSCVVLEDGPGLRLQPKFGYPFPLPRWPADSEPKSVAGRIFRLRNAHAHATLAFDIDIDIDTAIAITIACATGAARTIRRTRLPMHVTCAIYSISNHSISGSPRQHPPSATRDRDNSTNNSHRGRVVSRFFVVASHTKSVCRCVTASGLQAH